MPGLSPPESTPMPRDIVMPTCMSFVGKEYIGLVVGSRSEIVLYCIVLYSSIYIAPLNSQRQTEALLVRLAPRKETKVLRSDKDVERLDDRREDRYVT